MIMGTKKFREETLNELERQPMTMGGVVIDHAVSEKYLSSKGINIIMLAEAPMIGNDGTSLATIKLS